LQHPAIADLYLSRDLCLHHEIARITYFVRATPLGTLATGNG